jgi:hypothetical protein
MLDGFSGKLTSLATLLTAPVLIYPLLALRHLVSDMYALYDIHVYVYHTYIAEYTGKGWNQATVYNRGT